MSEHICDENCAHTIDVGPPSDVRPIPGACTCGAVEVSAVAQHLHPCPLAQPDGMHVSGEGFRFAFTCPDCGFATNDHATAMAHTCQADVRPISGCLCPTCRRLRQLDQPCNRCPDVKGYYGDDPLGAAILAILDSHGLGGWALPASEEILAAIRQLDVSAVSGNYDAVVQEAARLNMLLAEREAEVERLRAALRYLVDAHDHDEEAVRGALITAREVLGDE
jgi:hypothetical protein